MPGANPVTPVISAVSFLAGRCQGCMERPEKVEGRGQQDTHGGGWCSQPVGGYCELLVCLWGCARGRQLCAHSGVALVTLSHPQSSGDGQAEAQLSRGLCCPLCPGHSSHSSCPSTSRLSQPPELPLKGLEVPPCPCSCSSPGHSSQPVPEHTWEAGPEPAWKRRGRGIVLSWK